MSPVDLFGHEPEPPKEKPKNTVPKGYAWTPGTGPAGETCGTCKFHVILQYAGRYHKCQLAKARWTSGAGSDIRVRSPACYAWKPEENTKDATE